MYIFESDKVRIELQKLGNLYKLGCLWLKTSSNWRYCADNICFLIKKKFVFFDNYKIIKDKNSSSILILSNSKIDIRIKLSFVGNISEEVIEIKIHSGKKDLKHFNIKLNVNFDKKNHLDYIALSGNIYKNINRQQIIQQKVNRINAFSGIWTISSNHSSLGIISISNSNLKFLEFQKSNKGTHILLNYI